MYEKNQNYKEGVGNGDAIVLLCEINGEPVKVKRRDIKKYVETESFQIALQYYNNTKLWGLPNGNIGWANEPAIFMEAITALEFESKAMEHEEMEAMQNKSKTKGR